jgi:GTP:adenosylcobinamide-phosphate guanylyltransferase
MTFLGTEVDDRIDAIVLAGDKTGSKNFAGKNKMLLEVAGKPLLRYVVDALDRVERIRRIIVVGPADDIHRVLALEPLQSDFDVLEQKDTAYQNFWSSFVFTLGDSYQPGDEQSDPAIENRPVLGVPCDTPFISTNEINEFLDAAYHANLDYGIGMTEQRYLERFYPTEDKPGIRMTYLHLADASLRLNNLHFIKPFRVRNRAYIEQIYEFRYQKQFFNMLKVFVAIIRTQGSGLFPVYMYLMLQLSVQFERLSWHSALSFTRSKVTREAIAGYSCLLLQADVNIVETTGGGCTIDVDNEDDYNTIQLRFDEYRGSSIDENC